MIKSPSSRLQSTIPDPIYITMRIDLLLKSSNLNVSDISRAISRMNSCASDPATPFGCHLIDITAEQRDDPLEQEYVLQLAFPADAAKAVLVSVLSALAEACPQSVIAVQFGESGIRSTLDGTAGGTAVRLEVDHLAESLLRTFKASIDEELAGQTPVGAAPDIHQVRDVLLKITGHGEKGVIARRPKEKGGGFALTVPGGQIACMVAPSKRGWLLVEQQGETIKTMWTTMPTRHHFTAALILDRMLGTEMHAKFLFHRQEMNGIERKTFDTTMGVVRVHTHESGSAPNAIDFVVEIVATGEIRKYTYQKAGRLSAAFQSLATLPF